MYPDANNNEVNGKQAEMSYWFEELPKNYYVEVIAKKQGLWDADWNANVVEKKIIQIKDIENFKKQYEKHNLFRSLDVYEDSKRLKPIGKYPIVLDIDYHNPPTNYIPDLNDLERVRKVTIQAIRILTQDINVPENDIKIVFSGCKGFHIEVRREFSQACKIRDRLIKKLWEENGYFGSKGLVAKDINIDDINENHCHVRMKNTWNSWTNSLRKIEKRKCSELSLNKLKSLSINQIVDRSTK